MRLAFIQIGLLAGFCSAQVIVTISPQASPFPLPSGLALYSAAACSASTETRNRTVSAGQIRQVAESLGIGVQDPSLNASLLGTAESKTRSAKVVKVAGMLTLGFGIAGGAITVLKTQTTTHIGNAQTWADASVISGAIGAAIAIATPFVQQQASAAAGLTSGVAAALISDLTELYSVPQGGCMKGLMFFGSSGLLKPAQVGLP